MTTIKRIALKDRLRDAIRAFRRVPVQQIQLGVKVERCDKCERGDCATCTYQSEFKKLMALPNCVDCADRKFCAFEPKPGEYVRVNCPLYKRYRKLTDEDKERMRAALKGKEAES